MKTKRNNVTWESESSIKLLYVQSHIPPHLQSFVHGSPTFLQKERPEHRLSAFFPHFVSSLHTSYTLRHPAWHEIISLLVLSPFI